MGGGRMTAGEGTRPGIWRPIFWSAAAHLLAVLTMIRLGGPPGSSPYRAAVDVFLVGASGGDGERDRPLQRPSAGGPGASGAARTARRIFPASPPADARPRPPADRGPRFPGGDGDPSGIPVREFYAGPERVPAGESYVPPAPPDPSPDARQAGERPGGGSALGDGRTGAPEGPAGTGSLPLPGSGEEGRGHDSLRPAPVDRDPVPGAGTSAGRTGLLRERIQSRIAYPDEAVRLGQQGEVLLRIRIGSGGIPREILVARSSGARLLDDAARRGVVRAAPLPSAPGWVEVPILFRLR